MATASIEIVKVNAFTVTVVTALIELIIIMYF